MSSSLRPTDSNRPEPKLAAPGPRPISQPVPLRRGVVPARPQETASPSLRLEREPQPSGLTAGDRLTVSSLITGGEEKPRQRFRMLRLVLLLGLLVLAGIGAVTVYHAVASGLPR